jgi:hypothetical protein
MASRMSVLLSGYSSAWKNPRKTMGPLWLSDLDFVLCFLAIHPMGRFKISPESKIAIESGIKFLNIELLENPVHRIIRITPII